ncbi:MAG: hypothetical protein CR972_02960 [Candidatus Moraniibacteriota bacterium]|nr:MAG: hypothetical protein CR972_02960 [Candidatus Moranbacteria bacterium]
MPLIQLYYNEEKIGEKNLTFLVKVVHNIVCTTMNVKKDAGKIFTSKVSAHDLNVPDITVNVFMHPYEDRIRNREQIVNAVSTSIINYTQSYEMQDISHLVHIVFAEIETAFVKR